MPPTLHAPTAGASTPAVALAHAPGLQNARARREGRLAPTAKRELADFKREEHHEAWDVVAVGPPQAGAPPSGPDKPGLRQAYRRAVAACRVGVGGLDAALWPSVHRADEPEGCGA